MNVTDTKARISCTKCKRELEPFYLCTVCDKDEIDATNQLISGLSEERDAWKSKYDELYKKYRALELTLG